MLHFGLLWLKLLVHCTGKGRQHIAMAGSHDWRLLAIQSLTQARLYNSITPSNSITSTDMAGQAHAPESLETTLVRQLEQVECIFSTFRHSLKSHLKVHLMSTIAWNVHISIAQIIRLEVFQHKGVGHGTFLLKPWLHYLMFIPLPQKAREKVVLIWNLRHNSWGWWIRPDKEAGLTGSWKYPLKATWAHLIWQ